MQCRRARPAAPGPRIPCAPRNKLPRPRPCVVNGPRSTGKRLHTASANRPFFCREAPIPTTRRASLGARTDRHRESARSCPELAATEALAPRLLELQDQPPKQRDILPASPGLQCFASNFLQPSVPCGRESCSLPPCPEAQEHGSIPDRRHHQATRLFPPVARA